MSTFAAWSPITFPAEVEHAYRQYLLPRLIPLVRLGTVIGMSAFLGYQFWDLQLDPEALGKTGPVRLAIAAYFLFTLAATFWRPIRDNPRYLFALTVCTYSVVAVGFALVLAQLHNGFIAGVGGFILGMIFVPVIVFSIGQAVAALMPLIVLPLIVMALLGGTRFDIVNAAAWLIGGAGFATGFAYVLDIINRRSFQLERMLEQEKQRTEDLLLNILPAEIAERLKAGEEPLADYCESVSVLFADLVGFTGLSRKLPAEELVGLLNDLFSRFDTLVERHGAEKIKTIGDAYMAAAGLTGGPVDHVATIADLALDMRQTFGEFREHHNLGLKLRIGVNSGALVAGVIGKRKFAYDLWGDTVNVASRMESEGLPDEIQISEATRRQLAQRYRTTPRGKIDIKGHRPTMTHLLQASA